MCLQGFLSCVEAKIPKGGVASWQSSAVILDTVSLSIEFDFCCFNWVPPQVANQSPHVFGEWALQNSFVGQLWDFSESLCCVGFFL